MNRLAIILILAFCAMTAQAQTFLNHVQTKARNGATVTVTEDAKIDELVNNVSSRYSVEHKPAKPRKETTKQVEPSTPQTTVTKPQHHVTEQPHEQEAEKPHHEVQTQEKENTEANHGSKYQEDENADSEMSIPTVDLRKKVMRNSYKVTGYRVQVFAGGNTRKDRMAAEQAGKTMKMYYPEIPVYTHFYPPRWICRVGNYRTYGEAASMLQEARRLGYRGAVIVKGKISIQY